MAVMVGGSRFVRAIQRAALAVLFALVASACAEPEPVADPAFSTVVIDDEPTVTPDDDASNDETTDAAVDVLRDDDRGGPEAGRPSTTLAPPEPTVAPRLDPVPDRPPPREAVGVSACDRTLRTGDSIQDAIDEVIDRSAPYVLCLDGEFVGGGAPPSPDRPEVGPYYGTIVIEDRSNFTLRGRPGSMIRGVVTNASTPDDDAPPEDQHPFDKTNLIQVVNGSNIVIEGLTIDGFVDDEPVLNRLIWFQAVTDSVIRFNHVRRGGGECIRLKSNSQRNVIHNNRVEDCGVFQALRDDGDRLRKNGEAIYIGTDPFQIATSQVNRHLYWGLDPVLATDRSSFNWVHANVIAPGRPGSPWGNECVDIKEDWLTIRADLEGDADRGEPGGNVVSHNVCSGQFDPESGGFDSRGPANAFEHNLVTGEISGASIRVGANEKDIGGVTVDWRAPRNRVRMNVLASHGTEAAVKAWDDEPLAAGSGTCGNVDADGSTIFDEDAPFVSDQDAGENIPACDDDLTEPGPTVAVGPDLVPATSIAID